MRNAFFVYRLEENECPPMEGDGMSARFYLKVYFQGKSCAHGIWW